MGKGMSSVSGQYYALFNRELYDILHSEKGMLSRKPVTAFPIMPHLVKLLMFYAVKLQFISTNNTKGGGGQIGSESLTEYLIVIKY